MKVLSIEKTKVIVLLLIWIACCSIVTANLSNVALHKPTINSSERLNKNSSGLAVDGNTNQVFRDGSCTHTDPDTLEKPFWEVDLGEPYWIEFIRIYNRRDCCAYRLQQVLISTSKDHVTYTTFTYHNDQVRSVEDIYPDYGSVVGRWVKISLNYVDSLTLCEVEIMARKHKGDEEQQSEDENIPALLPCSCSNSCGDKFTREEITQQIYSLREMEKGEKDLYIMGALNQLGVEKKEHGKRKWTKYQYKVKGTSVCREFFKVAHDIKDFTLRALIKHIKANGIVARVHGNTGRKPKHAVRYDDVKRVFNFIVGYADIHEMPQPAAPRGRDDIPPIFLHSSVTKKAVYDLYKQSCLEAQVRVVSLRIVYDIWNQCCSHIQIASPRHDVCAKCEKTRKKISDSVAEEDILASTRELQTHIGLAQSERAVYQLCIKEAKSEAEESRFDQLVRPIPPMSSDYRHVLYTFDFAQNVSIPHHARQMGPLYFLTPRKIQIFGFRNDSISEQMNYLIDENQTLGPDGKQTHGPNAVISMVDDGLTRSSFGEPTFKLHADNCGGQNKNRYVMGYLAWRIMAGLNKEITYMMQVPGHGRCLADAGFAHLKRKYRFHVGSPGIIHMKKTSEDPEISVRILKNPGHVFTDARRPDIVLPAGLTGARKEYLYRSVRPFVQPQFQNTTCQAPVVLEE